MVAPEPTVGTVLVVRDGAAYLPDALASIRAQTLAPVDVVAVDDGSVDGSLALLEAAGVRVVTTPGVGPARARDRGVAEVAGDAIAFLDQDDVWRPDKLARQAEALRTDPGLGFVGGACVLFLEPGTPEPAWWRSSWSAGTPEPSLLPSATLYRRTALAQVGGFADDPRIRISEDIAWTARAQDLGVRRALVKEVVVERRVHGANASNDRTTVVAEHLAVVRASVRRKRADD